MIHITYTPSTVDTLSSGHIFFEIFTVFIFSHLIPNIKPVWNEKWNLSKIISKSAFLNFTAPPLKKYDSIVIINKYHKWESLSFQDFLDIKQTIKEAEKKHNTILIHLQNVCKIHPNILKLWYVNKSISNDIYSEKSIPLLRNMYYFDNNKTPINAVAIHIRRGDLLEKLYSMGFTMEYYKNIIININKILDIPIYIYCESDETEGTTRTLVTYSNKYNNDYIELTKLKNVQIKLGNFNNFSQQFNELTRHKYLFLSPSGFALWPAFISQGKILYDQKCVSFRPNLFKYLDDIPNFFQFKNPNDILTMLN